MKFQIEIIALSKKEQEAARKSDEYGFKKMLQDVIDNYTCPECNKVKGKLGFFVWEDEAKGLAVCSTCGFKKCFSGKDTK
jgi:transcription elongation factor Elf1